MSAINIILTPERALVFSDAAVYDADGRLCEIRDKVEIAGSRIVVTGRGNAFFPMVIAGAIKRYGLTIDDMEDDAGALIEQGFAACEHLMKRAGPSFNDIFIAGWSPREEGPKLAVWTNCPPDGMKRFSLPPSVMAPDLTEAGYATVRGVMGPMTRESFDAERLGLETMKAQRMVVGEEKYGAAGQYLVGGHVQRTVVSEGGVRKTVVHTWAEDRIGQRIRPAPDLDPVAHPNATAIPTISRAERRRLSRSTRAVA